MVVSLECCFAFATTTTTKIILFFFAHLFNKSIFIIMWTMQPQNFGYIDNMCPTNVVCVFLFYSFFLLWSAFNINLSSFNCRIINKINSNDLGRCDLECDLLFISMVFVCIRFSIYFHENKCCTDGYKYYGGLIVTRQTQHKPI